MKLRNVSAAALATLTAAALLALPVPAQEAPKPALAMGAAAPMKTAKMKGVDGKEVSIADVEGKKGTLVIFTCNACPYVKAWEERIVALGNEYSAKGIGVIAINSNDPAIVAEDSFEVMQKRAAERKMGFPYVADASSEVARAFGATRTPEAFLFDAAGKLVYHGAVDDNHKEPEKVEKRYLKDALAAVAGGAAVPVAESKAIGCSIKFKKQA
jgi:peroxiredoxin